jgi:predicted ATP-dependent endonuclease of OLD family
MKIKTLHINLYKSIKDPLQFEVMPVNILIGQNNCGKSNILYAVDYLFDVQGVSDILAYHKADIEAELEFSQAEQDQWSLPDKQASLSIKNGQRKLSFPKQIVNYQGAWQEILVKRIKHLHYEVFNDFVQLNKDWQSLQRYPEQLTQFKKNLAVHFPKIIAHDNALAISYEQAGLKEGKRKATIDHLGSGFRRIFAILLYMYHPDYDIVIIDEPETHLHPAIIKKLLWAMQNSGDSGQVLFTTHSPLFINSVTLPQVLRVIQDDVSTRAFGLPIKKQHYSYKRLIQELDADNVEMLFADSVVLVEGVSDRILLRGLIDRFYKGSKDIKVVQTHGKGNFNIYLELLSIFQIEYLVVADKDLIQFQLDKILNYLDIRPKSWQVLSLIAELKKHRIFIFPQGAIEKHYPKKYQRDDKKPINALYAATAITQNDFDSSMMLPLKEIINSL